MIMGYGGTRWKDTLWFENMNEVKMQNIKDFIPFDYPSGELISGFKKRNNKLTNEMYLFDDNDDEITPFNFDLKQYLAVSGKNQRFLLLAGVFSMINHQLSSKDL